MQIEIPYTTFCLMEIAMFVLFITVCEIITIEMCMTLTLTFTMGQGQT